MQVQVQEVLAEGWMEGLELQRWAVPDKGQVIGEKNKNPAHFYEEGMT